MKISFKWDKSSNTVSLRVYVCVVMSLSPSILAHMLVRMHYSCSIVWCRPWRFTCTTTWPPCPPHTHTHCPFAWCSFTFWVLDISVCWKAIDDVIFPMGRLFFNNVKTDVIVMMNSIIIIATPLIRLAVRILRIPYLYIPSGRKLRLRTKSENFRLECLLTWEGKRSRLINYM